MSKTTAPPSATAFLTRTLEETDPDVAHWIGEEERRQNEGPELIASESGPKSRRCTWLA